MTDATAPLAGYRVLEVGDRIAAAYCAKVLAELGADVVRVEAGPGGVVRGVGPWLDEPGPETSALHQYLNAGKRSLALDPGDARERSRLDTFLPMADIVVSGYSRADSKRLGITGTALQQVAPHTILVDITSWGQYGPYADYEGDDQVLLAAGGLAHMVGEAGKQPWLTYGHQGEYHLGIQAAIGAMATLYGREVLGEAQEVDIAGFEANAIMTEQAISLWTMHGSSRGRSGNGFYALAMACQVYPAADGFFMLDIITEQQWELVCSLIGKPEWLEDPRFADWAGRSEHSEEIIAGIGAWTSQLPKRELFDLFQTYRTCGMPIFELSELLDDPEHEVRGFFEDVDTPVGPLRQLRAPYRFDRQPARTGAAPRFGEHDAEVQREWGVADVPGAGRWGRPALASRIARSVNTRGGRLPLDSIRVIDMTQAWAGPLAAQYLAHLGAEVIKVESAARPDIMRLSSIYKASGGPLHEVAPFFHTANYNKLSLSLQLDTPEGKEVFRDLVKTADILIENFTARVMPNLGFPYHVLKEIKPDLVMVSAPAFGLVEGPYLNYQGHGEPMEGCGGLMALTGPPEQFWRTTVALIDAVTAFNNTIGALAGLFHRDLTGEGVHVDVSHFESCSRVVGEELLAVQRTGKQPERIGNRHRVYAPQGIYPSRGDDAWVMISVRDDAKWAALAALIGLDDPSLATVEARRAAHDRIDDAIAAWTRGRSKHEAMNECQHAGVAAAAVMQAADLVADRHLLSRGYLEAMEHPITGRDTLQGMPFKLSKTPMGVYRPAPLFGEHTDRVLRELVGRDDAAIATLRASGAAGAEPEVG